MTKAGVIGQKIRQKIGALRAWAERKPEFRAAFLSQETLLAKRQLKRIHQTVFQAERASSGQKTSFRHWISSGVGSANYVRAVNGELARQLALYPTANRRQRMKLSLLEPDTGRPVWIFENKFLHQTTSQQSANVSWDDVKQRVFYSVIQRQPLAHKREDMADPADGLDSLALVADIVTTLVNPN